MKRIFPDYAYGDGPREGCWWDQTCDIPTRAPVTGEVRCDVAIIGGGFTGISAALHLAQDGVDVAVLESRYVGFGASGRNGGFCCLGGGMLGDQQLDRAVGQQGRKDWRQTEVAAVNLVDQLTSQHGIDVDRHSDGETELAHRPSDFARMQGDIERIAENYGVEARITQPTELADEGLNAGFHGALTLPIGFGLNPRKYVTGLASVAEKAGARIYHDTPASQIIQTPQGYQLTTAQGRVTANRVVVATNGYSSEDLPEWLAGRYMPTQSSIIVTRPLTQSELGAQGWTSGQAAYDSRRLLHYFRLMPDNRMLFGLRGGVMSSPMSEQRVMRRARSDFEQMFPAWKAVETPHSWSGMVCIARRRMPFVGEVPDHPGLFASLCYHGNGVAMGSYCGALMADLVQDKAPSRLYPDIIRRPLARFELGRFRRMVMPMAYAKFALSDR